MLSRGITPFPEKPVCKQCLSKPCSMLFVGRTWPGKMIFVHNSQIKALPIFKPGFLSNKLHDDAPAVTDELAEETQEKKQVTVTNPRWEHSNESKKEKSPEKTCLGDTVKLSVDVAGVPEGASVTFAVFDVSAKPPLRIGSTSGKNEGGTASGDWVVEDPNQNDDALKLEFEGIVKSKASERAGIPVKSGYFFSC